MTVTLRIAEPNIGPIEASALAPSQRPDRPRYRTSDAYTITSVRSIELIATRELVLSHAGPTVAHDVDILCFGNSIVRHRNVVFMEASL
jgi:hypothetical protein